MQCGGLQDVETAVRVHRSDSVIRPREGHVQLTRGATYCGLSSTSVCTTRNIAATVIHCSLIDDARRYFKVPGTVEKLLTVNLTVLPIVRPLARTHAHAGFLLESAPAPFVEF